MRGKTTAEGPVYYGFCDGNLSLTEIAEVFASDPQSEEDDPAGDRANRRLIVHGQWGQATLSDETAGALVPWKRLLWPRSWVIREGNSLNAFVFNVGGGLTNGTVARWDGVFQTEWMDD